MRRRFLAVALLLIAVSVLGVIALQRMSVDGDRQARAQAGKQRREAARQRFVLYELLQPAPISNCELQRFGEPHDGGYLMCGNLLGEVQSAYSYGISGYDQWGCDISTKLKVPVHQYDCFDLTEPACPTGSMVFHAECVGDRAATIEGRAFDTIASQFAKNGDSGKRIVLKIDVEGAEWDSLLTAPDEILQQIDQLAVEFHWKHDGKLNWYHPEKYIRLVQRLKRFFEVAHVHFNNAACAEGLQPFPSWAYEVLFVSKQLASVDPTRQAGGLHPLDAPNDPNQPDCQPIGR